MTYPTTVLKRAAEQLKKRQEENKQISREKREALYCAVPELADLSKQIATVMKQSVLADGQLDKTREALTQLVQKREKLLAKHGYPASYLEDYYECPIFKEEGFVNSRPCECYKKLLL